MAAREPELDFDGRYRVERVDGTWHLRGPAFCEQGECGMVVAAPRDGEPSAEVLEKYRDLADLFNRVVAAERRRLGRGR